MKQPSLQSALAVLAVLLVLLLLDTQMPGAWRDEAFRVTQMPWQLSKMAHFVVFAALACVACQWLSVTSQIWCRQPSGRLSPLSPRITLNFP